jgi:hypothetical protein
MSMKARKPRPARSPFTYASKSDLQGLRILATEVIHWEQAVEDRGFRMLASAWQILGIERSLTWHVRTLKELEVRALRRLFRLPNGQEIKEARRVEFLRVYNSEAYETHMLRAEVTALRVRTEQLEAADHT